jgi:hypothetical protein
VDSPLVRPGFVGDREFIALNLITAVGEPAIQSKIAGGINGYIITYAITLNAVRSVLEASPGLKTVGDIPPVAFFHRKSNIRVSNN